MRFTRLRRRFRRIFDRTGNDLQVGKGSLCSVDRSARMDHCFVKLNGRSKLVLSEGARVSHVRFQLAGDSTVVIGPGCVLDHADICLWNGSSLTVGERSHLDRAHVVMERGKADIGPDNVVSPGTHVVPPSIKIAHGTLVTGDHNNLSCAIWIRFGGKAVIGRYNCINNGSEIRCDESVTVGSYNMISYDCDIWDTNTHCFYTLVEKKEMFEKDFPVIGNERNKPETRPVVIGDGNWIGKRSCILKGSVLGNETVLGTRAIVTNMTVGDGERVLPAKSEIK